MENPHPLIDWEAQSTVVLTNPRMEEHERRHITQILSSSAAPHGLIWFSTSGTLSRKWVGLTRSALLASATAVNSHLQSQSDDIWINALPPFHVGGIGIYARAYLAHASIHVLNKWEPQHFQQIVEEHQATLSALVPTQIHDLIAAEITAPSSIRAIVVGGGALSDEAYAKARKLGWPLLPSFGMTECASQIATAPLHSLTKEQPPELELLDHIQARTNDQQMLEIKSPSLLSTYANLDVAIQFTQPTLNGWLLTDDRVILNNRTLKVLGRGDDFIKIGGESVLFSRLESAWQTACLETNTHTDTALLSLPDERLGHAIHVFTTDAQAVRDAAEFYNSKVMPYERIRSIHHVPTIPRTPLGKVMRSALKGT